MSRQAITRLLFSLAVLLAPMSITPGALAHSGGTDASGGHYCRTNCELYGYGYGEYHFHNGGGSGGGLDLDLPPLPIPPVVLPDRPANDYDYSIPNVTAQQSIASIRWDNGDKWKDWRLDESVFGEGGSVGDVVATLSSPYPKRTGVIEAFDGRKWVAEDKASSDYLGQIKLTPSVYCKEGGEWVWCKGKWKYRVTVWQRGSSPGLRSKAVTLTFVRDVGATY